MIFHLRTLLAILSMLPASLAVAATPYHVSIDDPDAFRLTIGAEHRLPAGGGNVPKKIFLLEALPYAAQIERAARKASVDPALVHAMIHVESRHNQDARSPKGAVGLMQVLPQTAARYGVTDPERSVDRNLEAGTRYLRDLMNRFDNRLDLVLAAYNAGENAVLRHGLRIPPYEETALYVPAVLSRYEKWREQPPKPSPGMEYLSGTRLDTQTVMIGR